MYTCIYKDTYTQITHMLQPESIADYGNDFVERCFAPQSLLLVLVNTHTHTHMHTHNAHTHTHAHTHAHSHMHTRTHTHARTKSHTGLHAYVFAASPVQSRVLSSLFLSSL